MMALQIRRKIFDDLKITASAGIATNKFLAKLASEWNKPNGQLVIYDDDIQDFICKLPVRKINGVGEKTEKKLLDIGVKYFSDLQKIKMKKNGLRLYGTRQKKVQKKIIFTFLILMNFGMEDSLKF